MLSTSGLGIIAIPFFLILICSYSRKVGGNKESGNCTQSKRKTECCNNYYYNNGTCMKCPKGTFDKNCSKQCPEDRYGEFCARTCDCNKNQLCNPVHGCIDKEGICKNGSNVVICCNNYIMKDGYCQACPKGTFNKNCSEDCPMGFYGLFCKEKCSCTETDCDKALGCLKKDLRSNNIIIEPIYWIIPVISGLVIFILISICRRSRTNKHRHFVDIPAYQSDKNVRDDYDHMTDITMAKNSDTIDSRKQEATSSATIKREAGTLDEVQDTGEYHTLNLRVFDYEEPIKHEQLKRSQSENSSLYFECPARLMTSGIDDNNVSNFRRGSSLRQIRNTKDQIHESDEQTLTRKRHFLPENYVAKSVNDNEPTFDDFNVNNTKTLERKNMVPQSQLFLIELSSHLLNLQKY